MLSAQLVIQSSALYSEVDSHSVWERADRQWASDCRDQSYSALKIEMTALEVTSSTWWLRDEEHWEVEGEWGTHWDCCLD